MADNAKYVQAQTFTLAGAGAILGATSIVLSSFKQIDGVTDLTMTNFGDKGFLTLEPNNGTLEEQVSFTGVTQNANGTVTLTGVSNVLFISPYTESSGLAKTHAGGVPVIITNTAGFYNQFANKKDDETITGQWQFPNDAGTPTLGASYVAPTLNNQVASKGYADSLTFSGAPDASTTQKGIVQEASTAQVNAGTATGSTGALLFASPADLAASIYGLQLPSSGQKDALAGNSGTPSSSNKYVTEAGLAIATAAVVPSGGIQLYGGSSAPSGFLFCDGTSYLRATYPDLFTAIGTTYGSADGTHFNVPDMRGRVPIGVGTGTGGAAAGTGLPTGGSALTAVVRAGWKGEETHVLTVGELAAHTHPLSIQQSGNTNATIGAGNTVGITGTDTGSTGSDTAHNNIQPVMGLNFIIKT